MLQGIRGPADLGQVLAHHARHQQPALLEMVCRRPPQRFLQLRRPPSGEVSEQSRPHLGARAGGPG